MVPLCYERDAAVHMQNRVEQQRVSVNLVQYITSPSVLIVLVFSAIGLAAVLAATVVTADKLAGAWQHSEPTARGGSKPRGSRCASVGGRLKRSRDCPVVGRRKH